MKTIHRLALPIFLLVFLLAACAAPAPASAPSLAVIASATTAPIVVATVTQPQPTAVPTLETAASPNAAQQEQTSILPLVAPCNFADQPIFYSPSRTWVLVTCLGEKPEDGTITKIARMDKVARQGDAPNYLSLSFNELYLKHYRQADPNLSTLLQKAFVPVRWTKNEDFVYLAIQTSAEKTPFRGYDGLYRVDLASGKSRATLKPAAAPVSSSYDFKFSPDGLKLASINSSVKPVSIVISDTGSGAESNITLDARFTQGGGLLWSADGKKLVVSALDEGQNGGDSVIVYDLESMQNTYLVQASAIVYEPLGWLGTNLIYAESGSDGWAYIDLLSGTVTAVPATTPENSAELPAPMADTNIVPDERCINLEQKLPDDLPLSGIWLINRGTPYLENLANHKDYAVPLLGDGGLETYAGGLAISPDGTHMAYIDTYYDPVYHREEKRILRVISSSGQALDMSFWKEEWQWMIGWVDNQSLAIATSENEVVVLNPTTGSMHTFVQPLWVWEKIKENKGVYYYSWNIPASSYSPNLEWFLNSSDRNSVEIKNVGTGETVLNIQDFDAAAWSADSTSLAVISKSSIVILLNGKQKIGFNIFGLGLDYLDDPMLSPDGQKLAFNSSKNYNQQLTLLDIAQHKIARLCADGYKTWDDPAWSPDGRYVVEEIYDSNYHSYDVLVDTQEMRAYLLNSGNFQHRIAWLAGPIVTP